MQRLIFPRVNTAQVLAPSLSMVKSILTSEFACPVIVLAEIITLPSRGAFLLLVVTLIE
jgi:hypothetical protein